MKRQFFTAVAGHNSEHHISLRKVSPVKGDLFVFFL